MVADLLLALSPEAVTELRDRGLLAYHMNDFPAALRDLEEYLKVAKLGEADEDQRKDDAAGLGACQGAAPACRVAQLSSRPSSVANRSTGDARSPDTGTPKR